MPSIVQLRYALELKRQGHFGRAAQACSVAQPTLSTQIAKAEELLGVALFDRQQKPIQATPQGLRILEQAQRVLDEHDKLIALANEEEGAITGEFSLGIIPTLAPYVLPWFLVSFAKRYPGLKLEVRELTTEQILAQFKRHELDAAIAATPLDESSIVEEPLFYDPFYLYAHPTDPLLRRKQLRPSHLDPANLWLLADGHCFRQQVISYCDLAKESCGHFGSLAFVGGSFETLRHLVDASGGYTLIPEIFLRTLPPSLRKSQARSFNGATPAREVGLIHRKGSWKAPILQALLCEIRDCLPKDLMVAPKRHKLLDPLS